jgi:hypothetical protein
MKRVKLPKRRRPAEAQGSAATSRRRARAPRTLAATAGGALGGGPLGGSGVRFAAVVGSLLLVGLVALLAVNTSLAAGAIRLSDLQLDLNRKQDDVQAAALEVEELSSPQSLQQAAYDLGMVPVHAPVFLDPATGQLQGAPLPAAPAAGPQVQAPQIRPLPTPTPTPTPSGPAGDGAVLPILPVPTLAPTAPGAAPSPVPTGDAAVLPPPVPLTAVP